MFELDNGQVFPFNWKQVYNIYNDKYSKQETNKATLISKDDKEI